MDDGSISMEINIPAAASRRRLLGSAVFPALAAACLAILAAAPAVRAADAGDPNQQAERARHGVAAREGRLQALSTALNLDPAQQAELRNILARDRDRIRNIWADPAIPAAWRVTATQAESEETAAEIRALLNDEQRQKYKPPRVVQPRAAAPGPDVQAWIDLARPQRRP
jgi:Spy/CpxP family protein refolding chaperone